MYLFVFIFLLISVLGLYTQVYTLQARKMFENQTGIAEIMMTWHKSAYLSLQNFAPTYTTSGCSLNPDLSPPPTACATVMKDPSVDTSSTLPKGYNWADYKWKSIAYLSGSTKYVITYVTPPSSGVATDPIDYPSVGFSISDIYQQLTNAKVSARSYGYAGSDQLLAKNSRNYPLPVGLIPRGSLVIITPI